MKSDAAAMPKSVQEVPPIRLYSFRSCAGSKTWDGPQFCAVPVVPCAQATMGLPSAGGAPVGAMTRPVEIVLASFISEDT